MDTMTPEGFVLFAAALVLIVAAFVAASVVSRLKSAAYVVLATLACVLCGMPREWDEPTEQEAQ